MRPTAARTAPAIASGSKSPPAAARQNGRLGIASHSTERTRLAGTPFSVSLYRYRMTEIAGNCGSPRAPAAEKARYRRPSALSTAAREFNAAREQQQYRGRPAQHTRLSPSAIESMKDTLRRQPSTSPRRRNRAIRASRRGQDRHGHDGRAPLPRRPGIPGACPSRRRIIQICPSAPKLIATDPGFNSARFPAPALGSSP